MKIPINYIQSGSALSDLTVRFSFESSPFKKGSCGFFKNQIFLYTTYQAITTDNDPVDIDVQAGYVYSSTEKMIIKPLSRVEFTYEDSSDYNNLVNYLINGLKMTQRYILPHNCTSSLSGHSNLALVYGGIAYSENYYRSVKPLLFVFDKSSKSFIGSVQSTNANSTSLEESSIFYEGRNDNYKSTSLNGNSNYVDLSSIAIHLDRFQKEFIIIVAVKINDFFLRDVINPMIRIVDTDSNKELFFLPYKPSIYKSNGELLFAIDYQNDSWVIVPIFYPVKNAIQLEHAAQDYLLEGCPKYNQFDFNVKPLMMGKDYQLEMENQVDTM